VRRASTRIFGMRRRQLFARWHPKKNKRRLGLFSIS
jgi:hypothetical protein